MHNTDHCYSFFEQKITKLGLKIKPVAITFEEGPKQLNNAFQYNFRRP